ncbi:hypothetical protein RJ639_006358 [Escallonia herrerae]|uniref:RING-type E3 ubiquitin transferase n=1 Tax=Escallonia herrerae TaxID=1293975 RepID=A0AA88W0C0_9ASTE|nr:hypothetical protein RJ639_006358 [Escallonia herrerae]
MSVDGGGAAPKAAVMSVAVAVKGGHGGSGGRGSRRAVRWAAENLMAGSDRFVLVHVIPTVTSITTPFLNFESTAISSCGHTILTAGDHIPIENVDASVVAMYVQEKKAKFEDIFIETLVLEGDNPALALVQYVSESEITSLVLGSCSSSCILRKLKGPRMPSTLLKHAPDTCNIVVVSRHRLISTSANPLSTSERNYKYGLFTRRKHGSRSGSHGNSKLQSGLSTCSMDSKAHSNNGASPILDLSYLSSQAFSHESSIHASAFPKSKHQNFDDSILESPAVKTCPPPPSTYTEQSDLQAEVEQLHLELRDTVLMYNRACENLVHAQNKVDMLSSDCLEKSRRVNAALKREETYRKIAFEEKEKHLQAMKEGEMARNILAKEVYERQRAELKTLKESSEKQKIVDALFLSDRRYRNYTKDEIEVATDFFSETKIIGEGAYGKVYKCTLDHTPVAIKVLQSDASDKKGQFLKEVEVLSQLRHPHMVLLLGACPENGCLVYEYMENGSLEDHIYHRTSKPSLPWFIRFQIAFEVACGLVFLHNSKPEPIVHRDLKPGNILLDGNYVSKIGDVGLAKLILDAVPDNITEYRDTIIAGTFFYMDPEYQRTGTIRPKSDVFAFGIIILQLLAGRRPNGLLLKVENAIACRSFSDMLDKSIEDWPLAEAEELARMALKCASLRCRDRPDLESEVLPLLKRLADFADASIKVDRKNIYAPSHYYCPILQDVMDDPHIAADGFTYDQKAIKAWLERHNVSPVTKLSLQHKLLIPNHTLRAAIQEWRSNKAS